MAEAHIGFLDFARRVIDALEASDIPYLIGGAVAVWAWGEPRTTQDLDLVVRLSPQQIRALSRELETRRMLVPADIILELLYQTEGDLPINAVHMDSGYKAELFLLREDDAFRRSALSRRKLVDLGPPLGLVFVHAPEDLILNKTAYYAISRQTKHVRDIASILATLDHRELDWSYLTAWVTRLKLDEVWQEVKAAVDQLLDE